MNSKRSRIKITTTTRYRRAERISFTSNFARTMLTSMRCELNVYDLNCITAPKIHNMPNALYLNTTQNIAALASETATAAATAAASTVRQ